MQVFFLRLGGQWPQLKFLQTSGIVRNESSWEAHIRAAGYYRSRVIDMTLHGRWYIGGPAKIHNPLISVLYILCEVKLKFEIYA